MSSFESSLRMGAPLVRFYTTRRLPWCERVLDAWGVGEPSRWRGARARTCSVGRFGHRMRLDLSEARQRAAYFGANASDRAMCMALDVLLREGETFVDGAAGVGRVSLHGAGIVGQRGLVMAFEGDADLIALIERHVAMNGLAQVRVHRSTPGDRALRTVMRLPSAIRTNDTSPRTCASESSVLDEAMMASGDVDAPLVVRLDLSGPGRRALAGMERTIEGRRPAFLVDPVDLAGSEEIETHLLERGYLVHRGCRAGWPLVLVHPASVHGARLVASRASRPGRTFHPPLCGRTLIDVGVRFFRRVLLPREGRSRAGGVGGMGLPTMPHGDVDSTCGPRHRADGAGVRLASGDG